MFDRVKIVKPLLRSDIVDEKIEEDGISMVVIAIIPNLEESKRDTYVKKLLDFLEEGNCKTYIKELGKMGIIYADVEFELIKNLVIKSTFVFKVSKVPDVIASEIRESEKQKK
ncbi:MAG: hypothetical protein LVO36_03375 [Nitrosopumilus sp. (ex Thoosa mismalolli)]|nr:hypothetical protein [Nitrosopumilus sp. (ex Thoosa mismalolli)]